MVVGRGPIVMGHGFDNLMVVVLAPRSRCGVFNGLDFFFLFFFMLLFMVAGGSGWGR